MAQIQSSLGQANRKIKEKKYNEVLKVNHFSHIPNSVLKAELDNNLTLSQTTMSTIE